MEKVCFKTQKGPAAVGPYSTATIYGGVIYMSGMIGVNPATGKAPEGTLAQAQQVFENIKTVLGELGADSRRIHERRAENDGLPDQHCGIRRGQQAVCRGVWS